LKSCCLTKARLKNPSWKSKSRELVSIGRRWGALACIFAAIGLIPSVQTIVKRCAEAAGITKRVYPHLLRHSVATILLDSGQVPIDQVRKFLGHLHLSTTQIYAETSLQALGANYVRALSDPT
jgi:integrase